MNQSPDEPYFTKIIDILSHGSTEGLRDIIPNKIKQNECFPKQNLSEIIKKCSFNKENFNAEEIAVVYDNQPALLYFNSLKKLEIDTIKFALKEKKYQLIKSLVDNGVDISEILQTDELIDMDTLIFLLSLGFDINSFTKCKFENALNQAVCQEKNDIVSKILKTKNAKQMFDSKCSIGYNILFSALLHNKEAFELILGISGVDINMVDPKGNTLLHHVVDKEKNNEIKYLLSHEGIDPNIANNSKIEPIMCVKSKDALEIMLASDLVHVNWSLFLKYLIITKRYKILRALTKLRPSKMETTLIDNLCPITFSLFKKDAELMRIFLSLKNKSINSLDLKGYSALHYSVTQQDLLFSRLLVLHPMVDVNITNSKNGKTPLHVSIETKNLFAADLLLDQPQIQADVADINGRTPFIYACIVGKLEIVQMLFEKFEIDCNRTDNADFTPLMYSCRYGHYDIVKYVMEKCRVNPLICTTNGTAFGIALSNGSPSIIRYLISKDAFDPSMPEKDGYAVQDIAYGLADEKLREEVLDAINKKVVAIENSNPYIGSLYA